jgi:hypothetical protein
LTDTHKSLSFHLPDISSKTSPRKLIQLHLHPLIEEFPRVSSLFPKRPKQAIPPFLPFEYKIPAEVSDPGLYLFIERSNSQGTLTHHDDSFHILGLEASFLDPQSEFDAIPPCETIQTQP